MCPVVPLFIILDRWPFPNALILLPGLLCSGTQLPAVFPRCSALFTALFQVLLCPGLLHMHRSLCPSLSVFLPPAAFQTKKFHAHTPANLLTRLRMQGHSIRRQQGCQFRSVIHLVSTHHFYFSTCSITSHHCLDFPMQ